MERRRQRQQQQQQQQQQQTPVSTQPAASSTGYNNTLGKQLSNSLSEYDQLRTAPVTMNSDS
eukprot:1188224-Prorocentrum_minimum.AAC.2